jgi:hypothetical protein
MMKQKKKKNSKSGGTNTLVWQEGQSKVIKVINVGVQCQIPVR